MASNIQTLDLVNTKQTGDFCVHLSKLRNEKKERIFQLVSARQSEGCSTFVINVAKLLAKRESSSKILLVDANFDNPQLYKTFDIEPKPGLRQLLSNDASESDVLKSVEPANLSIITTGDDAKEDTQLSIKQLTGLFNSFREQFDYVLIDSVPLYSSHNSLAIALASDETFLVIQSGRNNVLALQKAVSKLTDHNCSINSAVLNRVPRSIPSWLYQWLV